MVRDGAYILDDKLRLLDKLVTAARRESSPLLFNLHHPQMIVQAFTVMSDQTENKIS